MPNIPPTEELLASVMLLPTTTKVVTVPDWATVHQHIIEHGYIVLKLSYERTRVFYQWVNAHYPGTRPKCRALNIERTKYLICLVPKKVRA